MSLLSYSDLSKPSHKIKRCGPFSSYSLSILYILIISWKTAVSSVFHELAFEVHFNTFSHWQTVRVQRKILDDDIKALLSARKPQ